MKNLWRGIFGEGFLSQVLRDTYLIKLLAVDWLRKVVVKLVIWRSIVRRALMDSFHFSIQMIGFDNWEQKISVIE